MQYQEIEWQDQYNTGIDIVDKAHRQLFSVVRRLIEFTEYQEKRRWVCEEGIKFFKGYTLRHFAEEEAHMAAINYSRYEFHKRMHDTMREKTLPMLEDELVRQDYSVESVRHFIGICLGWLTGHIMLEDMMIGGKRAMLRADHSIQTLGMLEQAVAQTVENVLGLKLKLMSEQYAVEGLGQCIGYQMTCQAEDGSGFKIILLFEEKVILETIGRMMGVKFKSTDELVISAAMEMANIIINRVRGCFDDRVSKYNIAQGSSISREMLQLHFEDRPPMYSLFFDGGEGQVAFLVDGIAAKQE